MVLIKISGNSRSLAPGDCRNSGHSSCVNFLCSVTSGWFCPLTSREASPDCLPFACSLFTLDLSVTLKRQTSPAPQLAFGSHGLSFLPELCLITCSHFLELYLLSFCCFYQFLPLDFISAQFSLVRLKHKTRNTRKKKKKCSPGFLLSSSVWPKSLFFSPQISFQKTNFHLLAGLPPSTPHWMQWELRLQLFSCNQIFKQCTVYLQPWYLHDTRAYILSYPPSISTVSIH